MAVLSRSNKPFKFCCRKSIITKSRRVQEIPLDENPEIFRNFRKSFGFFQAILLNKRSTCRYMNFPLYFQRKEIRFSLHAIIRAEERNIRYPELAYLTVKT